MMIKTLLLAGFLLALSSDSLAVVRTWDGGGTDANWQTATNWVGDVVPSANDDLVFPAAATQLATNNDFFIFTNFNSITIDGNFTIGGSPLRVGAGGLTVTSGTVAINTSISLNGAQTFTAGPASTTTVAVLSLGSFALRIDGAGSFGLGLISGAGAITKAGTGASLIAAASGYSGTISITDGIFVIDANIPNSVVNVDAPTGGVGGTGTVGAVTSVAGTVSAGTLTSPTGIFSTRNLSLSAVSNYLCKIGGTVAGSGGHDQLNVTGTVNLANARLVPLPWNNFRPAIGDSFVILRNDGTDPIGGTFLNAPEGALFAGPLNTAFRITYLGGDGNDIAIRRVPRAPFDFDGDGKSDVSVFGNSGWTITRSSTEQSQTTPFGFPSDVLTPADFDGDNRADIAVFRSSNGVWYILNSATATVRFASFGQINDIPIPNDFDGDGFADIAIFRPATGDWWINSSLTGQFSVQHWGLSGDKPLMGDFDGDGLGDLAVYRPSGGEWYILRSSDGGFVGFPFGLSSDIPVPADYDGDGRTDTAVFRATADGTQPDFYILRSGDSGVSYQSWGLPGDRPVVADYDGDGRADVAVERPGTGDLSSWFLLQSTGGYRGLTVETGILPVPSAYFR